MRKKNWRRALCSLRTRRWNCETEIWEIMIWLLCFTELMKAVLLQRFCSVRFTLCVIKFKYGFFFRMKNSAGFICSSLTESPPCPLFFFVVVLNWVTVIHVLIKGMWDFTAQLHNWTEEKRGAVSWLSCTDRSACKACGVKLGQRSLLHPPKPVCPAWFLHLVVLTCQRHF